MSLLTEGYQNGKLIAVLDPKNELYVQYRLRFDGPLRSELKNEGYGNLGWVTHMERMSMLSSIEDSKERDIEKQSYCEMEFWCQTKPRVENLHCLGCFGLQTVLSDGF